MGHEVSSTQSVLERRCHSCSGPMVERDVAGNGRRVRIRAERNWLAACGWVQELHASLNLLESHIRPR